MKRFPLLLVPLILLAGCSNKTPETTGGAASQSSSDGKTVLQAAPAASAVQRRSPIRPPASGQIAPRPGTLPDNSPPPPIVLDQEAAVLRSKSYDADVLVSSFGSAYFSGFRVAQSMGMHLTEVGQLGDLPRLRRVDLTALRMAGRSSMDPRQIGLAITNAVPKETLVGLKRLRGNPAVDRFAVELMTSAHLDHNALTEQAAAAAKANQWRKDALVWIVNFVDLSYVERELATQALPYLVQSLGLAPVKDLGPSLRLADRIAIGRAHHATRELSDRGLYELILNLDQEGGARKAIFTIANEAHLRELPSFLSSYSSALETVLSKTGVERARLTFNQ
jgi:hypothetical protein